MIAHSWARGCDCSGTGAGPWLRGSSAALHDQKGRTMGETICRTGSRGIRLRMRIARLAAVAALGGAGLLAIAPSAQAADGDFTGALAASASTVKMGSTFTVTESAINLGNTQVPGITVGIRRLGFTVVASKPPRTGICRIAGSATCSFLLLAPHETQTYTLTLAPTTAGTSQLTGWATQPIAGGSGGAIQTVTITVTP